MKIEQLRTGMALRDSIMRFYTDYILVRKAATRPSVMIVTELDKGWYVRKKTSRSPNVMKTWVQCTTEEVHHIVQFLFEKEVLGVPK